MVCNAGVVFLLVLASASIGVNAQSKPTVSFDRARVSVTEGTVYCFELQVVGFFNEPFSVDVRLVPASAEHFLDFALPAVPADLVATVNFTVGFINSTRVYITMVDNPAWEPVEYFLIRISIPDGVNALLGSPSTLRVNILDDDEVRVSFQSSSVVVNEGAGQLDLELTSIGIYTTPFSVTVRCLQVFPVEARLSDVEHDHVDAYPVVFTAHFDQLDQADTLSSRFSISIVDDFVTEPPEQFICLILRPFGTSGIVVADPDTITILIEDNDELFVSFTERFPIGTEGDTVTINLVASGPFVEPFRTRIFSSSLPKRHRSKLCEASEAVDYRSPSSAASNMGVVDFNYNTLNTISSALTIPIIEDNVFECTEECFRLNFVFELEDDGDDFQLELKVGTPETALVCIPDPDKMFVRFEKPSYTVGEKDGDVSIRLEALQEDPDNPGSYKPADYTVDLEIPCSTMDGSAKAVSDYTSQAGSVAFKAGNEFSSDFTVLITDDTVSECPEDFTVVCSIPQEWEGRISFVDGVDTAGVMVESDDQSRISFTVNMVESTEGVNPSFQLMVQADNDFQEDQRVRITASDGSAIDALDYTLETTVTSLSAGSTMFDPPITVNVVNNDVSECPESFTVSLILRNNIMNCGGVLGNNSQVTASILDDDDASISFTISSRSVDEDAGSFELTVESDNTFQEDQTVTIMTMDGTALASSDFDLNTTMVTLSAGSTTFAPPIMVSLVNNGISECPEMFKVCLSLPDDIATCKGIEGSNVCVDVTINDEDDASISFTISSRSVDEDAGSFELTVESDNTFQEDQTVTIMTMDGTALASSDFDLNTDMVTLSAGSTIFVPPIMVSLVDNGISECPEMFKVCLSLPDDITTCKGIEGSNVCVDVTIIDEDESKCGFTVPSMEVMEGRDPFYELSVRCDNPFQDDQVIVITATDGTAKTPIDYVLQTKMSMLTAGMNMFSPLIRTDITNDDVVEDVEMQSVNLVLPNRIRGCGAVPGDNQEVDVTILDDDSVFIRIVNQSFEVSEDGISISFQLEVANGTVFFPFNVNVVPKETTPVSATENEDFTATGGSTVVSFNPGETVSSTATTIIIDDDASDCDETFQLQIVLSLGPGQQRVVILEPSNIPVTIRENDENPLSFNTNSLRETEGPSLPIISTHVDARIPFQRDTVFTIVCTDGTANNVSDYELLTPTVTFSANSRKSSDVRVRILDDDIVEDVEMFQCVIELSQLQTECGVTLDDATLDVTIDDDDIVFLGLNLDLIPKEIVEGQGPAIVQLIVSNGTVFFHIDVLVSVREISSGNTVSAQEFLDFYVFGDENTAKLERFQNVSSIAEIRTVNNLLCEPPEMFEIVVTVSHPRVFILPPTIVNLTIIDDDINDPDFECFPPAVVTFKSDSFYLVERGSTYTRPVFRIGRMEQPLTIGVTTEELTATEGTDYTLQTTSITFSDIGAEFERVDVRFTVPLGDGEEPREAFRIDLQVPNDAGTLTRQLDVTVIITDKS